MSPITVTIVVISLGLLIIGALTVVSLFGSLVLGNEMRDRMELYAAVPEEAAPRKKGAGRKVFLQARQRLNSMLAIFIPEELSMQLVSANWQITETEYVLIRFGLALFGLVFGWLVLSNVFSGIGLGVILFFIPPILLQRSLTARRNAFERQLVDVLVLMTGAVRAGYSLPQAMDVVAKEMRAPAGEEFKRVIYETSLGLPLSQALNNLHDRMGNDDLYLLVTSININYQVGGNLVDMLDSVTRMIRDRTRLFGEVRALTAQQRFSSYVLTLLPFIVVGLLFFLNPDYIRRIFKPGITLCFPIGALIFILIGNYVIRKLSVIHV